MAFVNLKIRLAITEPACQRILPSKETFKIKTKLWTRDNARQETRCFWESSHHWGVKLARVMIFMIQLLTGKMKDLWQCQQHQNIELLDYLSKTLMSLHLELLIHKSKRSKQKQKNPQITISRILKPSIRSNLMLTKVVLKSSSLSNNYKNLHNIYKKNL